MHINSLTLLLLASIEYHYSYPITIYNYSRHIHYIFIHYILHIAY